MSDTYDYDEILQLKTAWYYYMEGLTQQEIGQRLGIPRLRVNRLIDRARKTGMVQFSIRSGHTTRLELERQLIKTFHLRDAFIAPAPVKAEETNENVALAAAGYIYDQMGKQDFLNMGYGDTMSRLLNHLGALSDLPVNIVSLTGGVSYYLPNTQSSVFNVKLHLIPTPLVLQTKTAVDAMLQEPKVIEAFELTSLAQMTIVGIGALDEKSTIRKNGVLSYNDNLSLSIHGAVGDILCHFFDSDGDLISSSLEERLISTPLSQIRKMENVIGVAAGVVKAASILAALKGNYLNVLITDEPTARKVLELVTDNE